MRLAISRDKQSSPISVFRLVGNWEELSFHLL
jgi:hypothetical protein